MKYILNAFYKFHFPRFVYILFLLTSEIVKKRIEEYEKLQEESKKNEECGRLTRTKTRAMAKEDTKTEEENTDKQASHFEKVLNSNFVFSV